MECKETLVVEHCISNNGSSDFNNLRFCSSGLCSVSGGQRRIIWHCLQLMHFGMGYHLAARGRSATSRFGIFDSCPQFCFGLNLAGNVVFRRILYAGVAFTGWITLKLAQLLKLTRQKYIIEKGVFISHKLIDFTSLLCRFGMIDLQPKIWKGLSVLNIRFSICFFPFMWMIFTTALRSFNN